MAEHTKVDAVTGTATTGHEWDGIKELNTPLPRWWLWVFYATIVWSVGYWIVYPAWPLVQSYTTGLFGYSSRAQVDDRSRRAARRCAATRRSRSPPCRSPTSTRTRRCSPSRAPRARRRSATTARPATAAAPPARRAIPTSTTTTGCGAARSSRSIRRSSTASAPATRRRATRQMPAFGGDGMLKRDEIVTLANYVRSLADLPTRPGRSRRRQETLRRELRRLPRRRRQGQPGARRPEPHRRHLALRRRRGDHHRDHHQFAAAASCRPGPTASIR